MEDENKVKIVFETQGEKQAKENIKSVTDDVDKNTSAKEKNTVATKKGANANGEYAQSFKDIDSKIKLTNLRAMASTIRQVAESIINLTKYSVDYIENLNLMDSAFGENKQAARDWVETIAEAYNFDESGLTKRLGEFRQFGSALGLSAEKADLLSKNLTLMSGDISSLYNLDLKKATDKVTSALTGETQAIRTLGADITQTSLQQQLYNMGINENIENMSRAEKAILIYLTLERQLANSQGDLAKTLNAPANQMRIFSEQTKRLARAIGNILLPVIAKILPYINGLIMALTEVINFLGRLLGFDMSDFEFGGSVSDFKDLGVGIDNVNNSLDNTGSKAKKASKNIDEMKKKLTGLRGFDKLNVITTPTDTSKDSTSTPSTGSGGVGGLGGGGINSKLLDQLDEYNAHLDLIDDKAKKIRDSILGWFGFTKKANGELEFTGVKLGTIVGGAIGLLAIFGAVKKIVGVVMGLRSLVGLISGKGALGGGASGGVSEKTFTVPNVKTILKGLADLALIVGGIIALGVAIGLLTKIPGFTKTLKTGMKTIATTFWELAKMLLPLAAVTAFVLVLSVFPISSFLQGMIDFAAIVLGTEVLVVAVGAVASIPGFKGFLSEGVNQIKKLFGAISDIAVPLALTSALIVALGFVSPAVVLSGLAGFAIIIGGLIALVVAIGELTRIDGFNYVVDKGAKTLIKFGEIIGGFAGSIVKGFIGKAFEGIENIGLSLSNFMINATPFIKGVNMIDKSAAKGALYLAETILVLTAANVLDGLTRWATGEKDMAKFGKELEAFIGPFKKFATQTKGIDGKAVKSSANAALAIANFAKNIPNSGGLVAKITGENSIQKFGKELKDFAPNFKEYYDITKKIKGDVVEKTANAAKAIAGFADKIPNSGGLISKITGDNSIKTFGKELKDFAPNFKEYYSNVKKINSDVVTKSADSAKAIAEFAKNLPSSGGIKSWFSGSADISEFGKKLKDFGKYFKDYYLKVKDINTKTLNSVANSIGDLIDAAKKIKDKGLSSALSGWGSDLKSFAGSIKTAFSNKLTYTNGKSIGENFGKGLAAGISKGVKDYKFPTIALKKSGKTIETYKMDGYAQGGFPTVGEMFIAREAGPEMVGQINGKTAVANNDQIVQAISIGVQRAIEHSNSGKQPIIIEATGDSSGLMNFITYKQKQQSRQYSL